MRAWPSMAWLLVGCAAAPSRPPVPDFASLERARIAELEDARDTHDGVLVSRARLHANPSVRARALLALAHVQDLDTAPAVAEALADPVPSVRASAAFAAGALALAWEPVPDPVRETLGQALLAAEARERDAGARLAMLDALGRVRTPATLARLVERLDATGERTPVAVRSAIALGVAARGKAQVPAASRPALEALARALLPDTRWAGTYALAQLKTADARGALLRALTDTEADVRAIAAKGLGDVILPEDVPALRPLVRDEDGRVAAEAVKSLVALAEKCRAGPCPAIDALAELEPRVEALGPTTLGRVAPPILALAQANVPEAGRRILTALRSRLRAVTQAAPESVGDPAAWLDCRLAAAEDRPRGWLDETLRCGSGRVTEARRVRLGLEVVAQSPRLSEALVRAAWLPYLAHPAASVRSAAAQIASAAKKPELASDVRPLLEDPDLIVRAAATDALAALGDTRSGQTILEVARSAPVDVATTYADALVALKPHGSVEVLRTWLDSPHAHIRNEGARALTALEGRPVRPPRVSARADAPEAPPLAPGMLWRLDTARGPVVIQPDVEAAPHTVAQLDRLAGAGFFHALTFHRVVPDFVVQGGDPRGDGEGGPGFTVRCEVSARRYVRGTVGMALAGKDTGGSQIFVALSPQPHLDARYTIIGTVVSGMEALDGLVEGDTLGDWQRVTR